MQWARRRTRTHDDGETSRRRRRTTTVATIAAVAILLVGSAAIAGGHLQDSKTDVRPVLDFATFAPTGGESVLTRTAGMVVVSLEAAGLEPGNAYTVWWVVFNNPDACSDGECGEDDVLNPDHTINEEGVVAAQIGIGNATGNVAKSNGTSEFGGRLKRHDTMTDHQVLFPAGFEGPGVLTASGMDAEIHLVVQDHGQARGGKQLAKQMSQVEFGCTPGCADVQFAVHK